MKIPAPETNVRCAFEVNTALRHRTTKFGGHAMFMFIAVMSFLMSVPPAGAITFPPPATVPANALRFSGNNQYVEVSNPGDFNLTTTLTIEAWVSVSAFDKSYQAIVTKGDNWGLVRSGNSGTKVSFRTKSGTTFHDLPSTTSLAVNQFYHIAAVYDGSTKFLYVNGQLEASAVYSSAINITTAPVEFGGNFDFQTQRLFKGTLDTIRIWSVARSPVQIQADIDRDLKGDESGLLGEWRFNEPSGPDAFDSSIGARHGTLRNMTDDDRVNGILFRPPPPVATAAKNALQFDGDDRQYVTSGPLLEPQFDLSGSTTLTLEAWINVSAFDKPWQAIVTKGEAWGLMRNNDTAQIAFRTGSDVLFSTSQLLPGRWYHISGVLTGSKRQIFIDGILDTEANYSTPLSQNDWPVVVGANAAIADRAFHGRIDLVRIWSTARTASELQQGMLRNLRGSEPGLIVDWRFNEAAGALAIDSSYGERNGNSINMLDGNRVSGLPLSPAPPPAATVPSNALSFSGGSGSNIPRVVIAGESSFDLADKLTIEAWVNVSAFDTAWQAIVTKGEAWGITRFNNTSKIAFRTHLGFAPFDLASTTDIEPNRWYHVAAVFDGNQKLLYIDGKLDSSTSFSGPLQKNDVAVVLGANAEASNRAFNGKLDAVRIWSEPRDATQIFAHLNRDLRGNEPGLLGEWRFNETAGSTATDSSVHGRDGTLTSSPSRVNGLLFRDPADGELAIYFDQSGANQYVRLPVTSEAEFDLQNQLTVEFWVSFDALPVTTVALISKGSGAWELKLKPSGKIQFDTPGLTIGGASATSLLSASTLDINDWHHIAVTWDGIAKQKRIYINGILDQTESGLDGTLGQNELPAVFAAAPLSSTTQANFFQGKLDEVRIWRIARSGARILDNYSRPVNGTEPLLVGVWSMSEGSGLTAGDGDPKTPVHGALQSGMTSHNRVEGPALGGPLPAQYSLSFDGVNDYIEIADRPALNPAGSATFEAWIKPRGSGFRTILYKGADGYGLSIDGNNYVRFFIDALNANALMSSRPVVSDVWQHVAVVVNGAAGKTTFYIDGKPAGTHSSAVLLVKSGALFLGRQGSVVANNYFNGEMDEVRIWSTARNDLELGYLAFRELPLNNAGLAAYYAFNQGSGTALADGSRNHIDGVLRNMDSGSWRDGQFWPVSSIEQGLVLTMDPSSRGLWVGHITLHKVNDVHQAINGASEIAAPTSDAAHIKVLLHVGSGGQVRMLKDVVVMQTQSDPQDPAAKSLVLVTDPKRLGEFQGVISRGGKPVGLRHGTATFDFSGNELPMLGGVGSGVGCLGAITLTPDFATNPFRHRYHPDHQSGYEILREFSIQFDGAPGSSLVEGPGYGVHRLTGAYRETITGLHKIPLKTEGTVSLTRISTVEILNNNQF